MPVAYKDYYKVLGVGRTAGDEDIRRAFRKLARKYHPDVAENKAEAEEKFKEVNEAYEVLSDPDKRKKYDALGADWKHGAEFRPPPGWGGFRTRTSGWPKGGDGFEFEFGGTGFSDFFEQFFGAGMGGARPGGFGTSRPPGYSQRGQDAEADIMVTLSELVNGSTRRISVRRNASCAECSGSGTRAGAACPVCGGSARVSKLDACTVKIPPGVREGQRLRLAGRGEAGIGQGAAGDLYLRVRLAKHPDYRVEGDDLYHEVDLAPWEAVLGAQVRVPTLDGHVEIKIPPGTNAGQKLRVRQRGLPGANGAKGDLYVITRIKVPERLSERERMLWEQLSRESGFKPRD